MPDPSREATLVLIKPDAIQKGLSGLVLSRLEQAKLRMVAAKVAHVTRDRAIEHYKELKDKFFFNDLLQHLCGELHQTDHVLAFVFTGPGAIAKIRDIAGATNPEKADPMSLRGAFGRNTAAGIMENVIHASANPSDAEREIRLWFSPEEMLDPVYPTVTKPGTRTAWA